MGKEKLIDLYEEIYGKKCRIIPLNGGGGKRKYYRLTDGDNTLIGVVGDDIKENTVFININKVLKNYGIDVPSIYKISSDKRYYLMEDLGDVSLFTLLFEGERMKLAKNALEGLSKICMMPENLWIDKVGFPPFSSRLVRWDLNYFKYDFLKPADIKIDEESLEDDFDRLTEKLSSRNLSEGFMYRDFQSRNIMVKDKRFFYIDFQGCRKGPLTYDAISFIRQAKAPFTFEEREELSEYYIKKISEETGQDPEKIRNEMHLMELFRNLQVLGAYGFRGLIERKQHFLESIVPGVESLCDLKEKGKLDDFPEIGRICQQLRDKYLLNKEKENEEGLTINIISFSYKKGYPEDSTGNGGGFMFDCRGLHNPGRYEQYKTLTGKDREVIEFLENEKEARDFIKNAESIVFPSIEKYLSRGFTSLQVGFGCTGGQHRSVYCAEQFAARAREMYPKVNVKVTHREQSK